MILTSTQRTTARLRRNTTLELVLVGLGKIRSQCKFKGILQTDGYVAYDKVGGTGMVHACCWAHSRRKVFDALKLNPDHPAAKANYKSLALELERIGAQLALAGKPSFNCATARRPVEKAICANAELADLDREIVAVNARLVREAKSPHEAQVLQREQDEFITGRNATFSKAGYDLKKAMQDRLSRLNASAN